MDTPIRGKVARILNSREIAINVGSDHGVLPEMYFDIMDQTHQDIQDPDTGALLGSIDRAKVRVKVVLVKEKLSLASTYKKKEINLGGIVGLNPLASGFSQALLPPNRITKYETLKTEENTWQSLYEHKSFVKTGDPVVQAFPFAQKEMKQHLERVDSS